MHVRPDVELKIALACACWKESLCESYHTLIPMERAHVEHDVTNPHSASTVGVEFSYIALFSQEGSSSLVPFTQHCSWQPTSNLSHSEHCNLIEYDVVTWSHALSHHHFVRSTSNGAFSRSSRSTMELSPVAVHFLWVHWPPRQFHGTAGAGSKQEGSLF